MIYYLDQVQTLGEGDLTDLLSLLSQERRACMERYRFPKDRIQSALAYLLLRYGLIKDYGIYEAPRIERSKHGKPNLLDYPDIYFNLSHCEKAVACGFSAAPIGIDVQHLVPYKPSLADYFMTAEEKKAALLTNPDREFTRLWSLKESYGKCVGCGICYPMSEEAVGDGISEEGYIIRSHCLDGFYLSSCGREELFLERIPFDQLKTFLLNYQSY